MNRGIVTQLAILLVIVARAAADTMSIEPKIIARRQVCLVQQFDAHVSEFDGRRFRVHIVLTGCGGNRKVPASCSPYAVPRDSAPETLRKLTAANDELLAFEFDESEVTSLQFNGSVSAPCPEREFQPKHRDMLPPTSDLFPMRHVAAIFTVNDARSLGVEGEMVGAKWAANDPTGGIRAGSEVSLWEPTEILTGDVKFSPGTKIAVVGVDRYSRAPAFYVLDGVVEKADPSGYTMTVHRIVQAEDKKMRSGRVQAGAPTGAPAGAPVGPSVGIHVKILGSTGDRLPWAGVVRGLEGFLPLQLRGIRRSDGERMAEIVVGKSRLSGITTDRPPQRGRNGLELQSLLRLESWLTGPRFDRPE